MNTDNFENQLERQSLRQPPAGWRGEILAAARAQLPSAAPITTQQVIAGWRAWLARIPVAWTAVAAVWVFILGVNLLISGPDFVTARGNPRPGPDALAIWSLRNAELSLLADQSVEPPPRPAAPAAPAPRSDRRREEGWGELGRANHVSRIV